MGYCADARAILVRSFGREFGTVYGSSTSTSSSTTSIAELSLAAMSDSDNTPRFLAGSHQALQGYLDDTHRGVWQEKVHPKLVATPNVDRKDFAYICKKTIKHKQA